MKPVHALLFALIVQPLLAAEPRLKPVELDPIVKQALAQWRVPGAAVAIVLGSETFAQGYGLRKFDAPEPVTAETLFPLASCTKAFTTTLLAMLADEGRLHWDDPVRKHLPTFRLAEPHADALVTLRDLVSHRTGVRGHDLLWYHAPWDGPEILRRIEKLPVDRPFRGGYEYSTLMVMAAGQAAANRVGRPWDELIRERILAPLGMGTHLVFCTAEPRFQHAERATGHRRSTDDRLSTMPIYATATPNPAGSIHLTAREILPWLQFHLGKGEFAGKRLLVAAALEETHSPINPMRLDASLRRLYPDTVQMSYAMGWLVYDDRGRKVIAHGGMIDGFRVQVTLFPNDQLAIACLNNLHDTKMNLALTNSLADHLLERPGRDWNQRLLQAVRQDREEHVGKLAAGRAARRANVPPSLPSSDYSGTYQEPAYGTARITWENGKLYWNWSTFRAAMEPWEGDTFRITEGFLEDELIVFRIRGQAPDALQFLGMVFRKE